MKKILAADRARILLVLIGFAMTLAFFAGQRRNPPGFYVDESSIAYNAFTIATRGADEYGYRFPLYFRAFGEYKNPLSIYLLAGVFKVAGPGILTARRVSALLGWLAALVLAALAWRITRRRWITMAIFATALFTPMLFEISRLAFEVAAFPLAVASFLLFAHRAATNARWPRSVVAGLALSLTAATYAYTAGRVLAPAFLLLLLLFATRVRRSQLAAVFAIYALLALVPLAIYSERNPGALAERARGTSYLNHWRDDPMATLLKLEHQTLANIAPLAMSLRGDPNARHHVPHAGGSMLAMTFILAGLGLTALRLDRWTLFLAAGAFLSLAPAAVTEDLLHTLRLAAWPVFLIALSIEALRRAGETTTRRWLVGLALIAGAAQAIFFFAVFQRHGAERRGEFDDDARIVMTEAVRRPERPIYARGLGSAYAHAYWYGALHGVPREMFRPYPAEGTAPPASLVVATGAPCDGCTVISRSGGYVAFLER
jgi:4-amino-4-deoxy-L-arabinose transferase-like glycosyltransferase